jgi:hypothetical protein
MESNTDALSYYASHGPITDPGPYAPLFAGLPTDIRELAAVVRGLLFHYAEGKMYNYAVPTARIIGDEARTVAEMLSKIMARRDAPLTVARPPARRLVGCCRDYAVLLTAMLRHQGVPARVRFGFSRYFAPGFGADHVVCEYWDRVAGCWRRVDAQQDALHCRANNLAFDPHDIPAAQFPVAGAVWQGALAGALDPAHYGYDRRAAGLWVIQSYLVHDLAALNQHEMFVGDSWGLGHRGPQDPIAPADAALLDQVAVLTLDDGAFTALRALYDAEPRLRVPPLVHHFTLRGKYRGEVPVGL